jgi:hypothetical protein
MSDTFFGKYANSSNRIHKSVLRAIWSRAKMIDPVRQGLQKWADHIDALTQL